MLITVGRGEAERGSERGPGRFTGKTKPWVDGGGGRDEDAEPRREYPRTAMRGRRRLGQRGQDSRGEARMTATPVSPGIDAEFEAIIAKLKPFEDPVPAEGDQPQPAPEEEGREEKADDKD